MFIGFSIFGWIGIVAYVVVMLSAKKLLDKGESALLHLLLCFVFILWLPLPLCFSWSSHNESFLLSSVFGCLFLVMMIVTMALQVGHLGYSSRQRDTKVWDERDSWMIHGMLGDIFESVVYIVFNIWTIMLAVGFFVQHEVVMGCIMIVYSLFIVRSLFILLNKVVRNPIPLFATFKPNPITTALKTLSFFLVITCWMSFR